MSLQEEYRKLQEGLTGDMFKDMEAKERMHEITMQMNGVKPDHSIAECVGCGS